MDLEHRPVNNVEWEMFFDSVFYYKWAVRDKADRTLNSPRLFHLCRKEDAELLMNLLNAAQCNVASTE